MSNLFHRIGLILGPAAAILPILGAIPGLGHVAAVAMTVVGTAVSVVSSIEKAKGKPTPWAGE